MKGRICSVVCKLIIADIIRVELVCSAIDLT